MTWATIGLVEPWFLAEFVISDNVPNLIFGHSSCSTNGGLDMGYKLPWEGSEEEDGIEEGDEGEVQGP